VPRAPTQQPGRIEVPADQIARLASPRCRNNRVDVAFREYGYATSPHYPRYPQRHHERGDRLQQTPDTLSTPHEKALAFSISTYQSNTGFG